MGSAPHRIAWDALPREIPVPGLEQQRVVSDDREQARILTIAPGFTEDRWCERRHIGIVLEGTLVVETLQGKHTFQPGDGIWLPGGPEHRHRLISLEGVARIFLVEPVGQGHP